MVKVKYFGRELIVPDGSCYLATEPNGSIFAYDKSGACKKSGEDMYDGKGNLSEGWEAGWLGKRRMVGTIDSKDAENSWAASLTDIREVTKKPENPEIKLGRAYSRKKWLPIHRHCYCE